jgi:hypothetical protein
MLNSRVEEPEKGPSMDFQGALITEQGVEFCVVQVNRELARNHATVARIIGMYEAFFGRPIVLMSQDQLGQPTYYGRHDLTRMMAYMPLSAIHWESFKAM